MKIGDRISGKVSGIQPYGVFVNLANGKQGLVHISELKHGFVTDIENEYKVGDRVEVVVMDIDEYDQKVSLSIRALQDIKYGRPILHKHFWTNYKNSIGYQTIKGQKSTWIRDAMKQITNSK
ncbi:CvfD/Ygs/GSP13 family RNA-binding post-transcriptional regulator [Companilactobacillus mishanensis]|uniref:S1 RNA-binding domain-containing protein n=1 Tax=Companilactobacillus mishanensis TaxID=2486008 RepID=A0A5P0ZII5_9LACO|nr:CvfD/Ygs/GSP13 family RNA-binding post-transcriptional regulator [Companilactobacillus mishanensis]MQS52874.1 S1 RNA-binding domain-containing protein [Companilactobacillus mishanensis]